MYPLRYAAGMLTALALVGTATAAAAYQEGSVADGGSVRGKITYAGIVEKRMIVPTKDQEVCGGPREEPEIAVDAAKGVGYAVVYLSKVEAGKAWAPVAKPKIDNKDCRFVPDIQVVRPGAIAVLNSDPVLHNTHAFYGRRTAFNMALPNQGQSIDGDLPRPGMVRIECDAHGWMLGWVFVADNPYYAITAADGTFTIGDIPEGTYTVVAHHPALAPSEVEVVVKPKQAAEVSVELKKSK